MPSQAKENLEKAIGEYVAETAGKDHWAGDYVLSVVVLDMNGIPEKSEYIHTGRGPFHSMRGLTEEQADWLVELKMEEREDDDA